MSLPLYLPKSTRSPKDSSDAGTGTGSGTGADGGAGAAGCGGGAGAFAAPLQKELPARIEFLDAAMVLIAHVHVAVAVDRDIEVRAVEQRDLLGARSTRVGAVDHRTDWHDVCGADQAGVTGTVAQLGEELGVPTPTHKLIATVLKLHAAGTPKS